VIGFLKVRECRGKEIYIRPAPCLMDGPGLLVDDIDQVTVEDMKAQGLQLW